MKKLFIVFALIMTSFCASAQNPDWINQLMQQYIPQPNQQARYSNLMEILRAMGANPDTGNIDDRLNLKVDSLRRQALGDTVWQYNNGTRSFAFRVDSFGTGGLDTLDWVFWRDTINRTVDTKYARDSAILVLKNCRTTSTTTRNVCTQYVFNGNTYTASGSYKYTTTNSVGCDSIATLSLTIRSPATSSSTITACDSYDWDGTTYTTSGTYANIVTNGAASGCDSTATLYLTIAPTSFQTDTLNPQCKDTLWLNNHAAGVVTVVPLAGGGDILVGAHNDGSLYSAGSSSGLYLPLAGDTMDNGSHIYFGSGGQNISQGTFTNGTGGDSGIALMCAIGYEGHWEGGHWSVTPDHGVTFIPFQVDSGLTITGNVTGNNYGTNDSTDLILRTNNTERMRVTGAGNVGIGTSSPPCILKVVTGTGEIGTTSLSVDSIGCIIQTASNLTNRTNSIYTNLTFSVIITSSNTSSSSSIANFDTLGYTLVTTYVDGNVKNNIDATHDEGLYFTVNRNGLTPILFLDSSQKVGIGTSAPLSTLDIRGQVSIVDGTEGAGKVLTSDVNGLCHFGNGALPHTIFTPTTGQTVNLVNNNYNAIDPSGALLALTINFPSSPADNDVVEIKFDDGVTTITYSGGTVLGGITTAALGAYVKFTYDSNTTSWY